MKWLLMTGLLWMLQPGDSDEHLTVTLRGQTVVEVNRTDYASPGFTMVNMDKFDQLVKALEKQSYEAPRNAFINDHGGIHPEMNGHRLHEKLFTEKFFGFFYGTGSSVVDMPLMTIHPRVDSELLANIKEKPIGQYATYFNSRNKNRSHNILLATKAINNTVLFPGETFSFNKVVGQRTKEKGYLDAPVIVRGELSEGIGGGICQVSSTLFNATDRAGLRIVKRYSHSRSVPYVRPGRDATVSWNGPDFVFQNLYNQPILIRAQMVPGKLFVSIYSSYIIEYKPRAVPGMLFGQLPEEISASAQESEILDPLHRE